MYIFGFSVRACFRIAVYAFGMNKKRHILVDIGHFSNGTLLNETSFVNIKVLQCENAEKIQKGHCVWIAVRVSYAVSV